MENSIKKKFIKDDLSNKEFEELILIIEEYKKGIRNTKDSLGCIIEIMESDSLNIDIESELELLIEDVEGVDLVREVILYFSKSGDFTDMYHDWSVILINVENEESLINSVIQSGCENDFLAYLNKETLELENLIRKEKSHNHSLQLRLKCIRMLESRLIKR